MNILRRFLSQSLSEDRQGSAPTVNPSIKRRTPSGRLNVPQPVLPPELVAAMEQLDETTGQQLLEFFASERPDLARDLEEEFKTKRRPGPKGLRGAVRRMSLRKAAQGLYGHYDMSRMAADGELVVALPVPPHIEAWVFEECDPGFIFAAEDHLPPHLEDAELQFLEELLPTDAIRMFSNVRGILTEGQIRGGIVSTRRSVVRLIQMLPNTSLTIFLHHMPHRPPHAQFATVDKSMEIVEIA